NHEIGESASTRTRATGIGTSENPSCNDSAKRSRIENSARAVANTAIVPVARVIILFFCPTWRLGMSVERSGTLIAYADLFCVLVFKESNFPVRKHISFQSNSLFFLQ